MSINNETDSQKFNFQAASEDPEIESEDLKEDAELPEDLLEDKDDIDLLDLEEDQYQSIEYRISKMSIPQQIDLALKGNRSSRLILVRSSVKQVALSALSSPKMTTQDAEDIAKMRSVSEEILREIGAHKAWSRSYSIVKSLVANPKTPIGTSLPILNRLYNRDLSDLQRSHEVPEPVKRAALQLVNKRQKKK